MQLAIGKLLRTGVFASVGIAFSGGVIYLLHHGHETVDYRHFKGAANVVHPVQLAQNIAHLNGNSIIQAGIIMLIATPVLRVIFSAFGFIAEKDYLYTFITLLVLGIIVFSMVYGV